MHSALVCGSPGAAAGQPHRVTQCSGIQLTSLAGPSLQWDALSTIALGMDKYSTVIIDCYRDICKHVSISGRLCVCVCVFQEQSCLYPLE